MQQNKKHISLNCIERRLRQNHDYEISQKAILVVRDHLEDILNEISQKVVCKLREINKNREIQRLPKLRRIDCSVLKNLSTQLHKQTTVNKHGKTGQDNRETVLSQEAEKEVV